MVQLSLESSIIARDAAMQQVEEHARTKWQIAAMYAIWATAQGYHDFIVDMVWTFMPEGVTTHENRAMGPMMVRAAKAGWITPTDQYRLSERVTSHRNPRRIWVSQIYVDGNAPAPQATPPVRI